jgi:Cu(I)/Ag(I) efflux system membrane fusion protein
VFFLLSDKIRLSANHYSKNLMLNKILTLASITYLMLFTVTSLVHAANSGASVPFQSVTTPYIQIHDALAKDSLDGVSAAATALEKAAQSDKTLPTDLGQEAQALALAKDLDSAREAFKPLSETLIKALGTDQISSSGLVEAYCPMKQAHWLQTGTTVSNPFGASMATCGSIVGGKAPSSTTNCPMGGGCCM